MEIGTEVILFRFDAYEYLIRYFMGELHVFVRINFTKAVAFNQ
jgi:hypothetical protein